MRPLLRRWFLPEVPDVLGILGRQGQATVTGLEAYQAWASGEQGRADELRASEHEADRHRRALLAAIETAFVTPIGPEDIYELSERLDVVLNGAKNLVRESEVLAMAPDQAMAEMAGLVAQGARELVAAFPLLLSDPDRATGHADAAVRCQRDIERTYRRAMSAMLEVSEVRVVMSRRELYRRSAHLGEAVELVAHRIWYAVVKQR